MYVTVTTYADLITRSRRRRSQLQLEDGARVADLLGRLSELPAPAQLGDAPHIIRNGFVCDGDDELLEGDELHVAPAGGEPITIVLAAVALLAIGASALLAPKTRGISSEQANERTRFGFGRFSNELRAGDPLPVVYGERQRYGGMTVNKIPSESSDGSGDQRLRMLICLSEGEIEQIGDQTSDFDRLGPDEIDGIYINDQPISTITGVRVSGRMGTAGQSVMRGFRNVETLRDVGVGGIELENTLGSEPGAGDVGDAVSFTTQQDVDAAVVRVRFPSGLYQVLSGTQLEPRRVVFRHRHRVVAGSWSAWTNVSVEQSEQSEFFASPRIDFAALDTYEIQLQRVSVETADGETTIEDRMLWDSVIEIQDGNNNYANLAMLGITFTANEQVQAEPRVSVRIKGKKVRTYTGGGPSAPTFAVAYSDNPLECALDHITNARHGMGSIYSDGNMDWGSWIDARDYAAEQVTHASGRTTSRFRLSLAMLDSRDGVDWLRVMCSTARCTPGTVGNRWRFIQQRPMSDPVEVFTDGRILVDDDESARIIYRRALTTGGKREPNQLVAEFENGEQADERDVITYPKAGQQWLGAPENEQARPESLSVEGINDQDIAVNEVVYRMKARRGRSRRIRFDTTKPVVVTQPGDRFDLASSLPGYGFASGSVMQGSTEDAVVIDRTVTLDSGSTYQLQVAQLDGSLEVRDVTASGTVERGQPIGVSSDFAQAPGEGADWALLVDGKVLKPYICESVSPAEDSEGGFVWTIAGLEYVEDVFDPDPDAGIDDGDYSTLADPGTPPGPVINLQAYERIRTEPIIGDDGQPTTRDVRVVELSWQQTPADAEITSHYRVFRRIVGTNAWVRLPQASIVRRTAILELLDFDRNYQFCVVAVSLLGAALSEDDPRVPVVSLAFGSGGEQLPPPENLTLEQVNGNEYRLTWDAVDGATQYQVLSGRHVDAQVNSGAFDGYVWQRTQETAIEGIFLAPGRTTTFMVRSVGPTGRMSKTISTVSVSAVDDVPGLTVDDTELHNLQTTGTRTNCSWVTSPSFNEATQLARLESVSAASEATYESAEIDLGTLASTTLNHWIGTASDVDMNAISTDPLTAVPGIEADQWGIVKIDSDRHVGMLFPPFPDEQHGWVLELRTYNGVAWSSWLPWAFYEQVTQTMSKYQVRVRFSRQSSPYRPALQAIETVASR